MRAGHRFNLITLIQLPTLRCRSMRIKKSSSLLLVLGILLVIGIVAEAYVLYFQDNPVLRLYLGLLCAGLIAWPIAITSRQARSHVAGYQRQRRFFRLRRALDAFLDGASRLNWLVIGAEGGPRDRQGEIDAVKNGMRELLEEIFLASGEQRPGAESDAPFEPRFRSSNIPHSWTRVAALRRAVFTVLLFVVASGFALLIGRGPPTVTSAPIPVPFDPQDTIIEREEVPFRPIPTPERRDSGR